MTVYSRNDFGLIQGPAILKHSVPIREHSPLSMVGTMTLSKQGFVYRSTSRIEAWTKFLGLGLLLPAAGVASAIARMAQNLFGYETPKKGLHDLKHTFHLAGIAWKAVIGWEGASLIKRIEEFSLAEIDYNNIDRMAELEKPQSERFRDGLYIAKCMNPFFHKIQYNSPNAKLSAQCSRYADTLIRKQHENSCVQTTECECCDIVCYKETTYCGCVSKIECCAIPFITVNCCNIVQCCLGRGMRRAVC